MANVSLADGQVATSAATGDEYVAVGNVRLTFMSLFNTNAANQTVVVYLRRFGSTNRVVARFILKQYQRGSAFIDDQPYLSKGDALVVETTTASAVDFFLSGETY